MAATTRARWRAPARAPSRPSPCRRRRGRPRRPGDRARHCRSAAARRLRPPASSARLASFSPSTAIWPTLRVALVDHDLAVDLVGRAVEQPVGHHVVEHAASRRRTCASAQSLRPSPPWRSRARSCWRSSWRSRLPDRRRPRRCAGRCASNSGLHFAIASAGPEANTPAVPEETSSGRPIIGAATSMLALLGVRGLDLADDRNAVGAGADVDAALRQRREQAAVLEHDVFQRGVVGQHGVDGVAVARGVGDRSRRSSRRHRPAASPSRGVRL